MQRKVSKEKFYYGGKNKTSQDLVHQHMSNHYRKILNAQKAVDNGYPQSYKVKRLSTSSVIRAAKSKVNRQLESPALTDRSISTNSNKGSCWGAESCMGSSRYHTRCIPESPTFGASNKHNVVDMELVNRITYDTKKGPSSYCGEGWTDSKSQHNNKALNAKQNTIQKGSSPSTKRRLPTSNSQESAQKRKLTFQEKLKLSQVTVKENKCFSANNYKFYPRILQTNAVSKLRSLRVYHPPRRKQSRQEPHPCDPSNPRINSPMDVSAYKCSKIAVDDTNDTVLKKISVNPKEQSLTSSRDSAYNGGISSLPESRSPTPDEKKKNGCCCCCCQMKYRNGKVSEKSLKSPKADSKAVENKVEPSNKPQKVSRPSTPNEEENLKKIKEDELYVKFIQDITTEVLKKNLYTNKALKNVMKKHIKNNLITLNQDRMLKEVEYLRTQLGIPEDKSLLQIEGNTEESENDSAKHYPIISDSEFVMPKKQTSNMNLTRKINARIIGNSSPDFGDDKTPFTSILKNKRQIFSMIQSSKLPQEKKIPMVISRENSFDDSDQPFGLQNLQKETARSDSFSSTDSDIFTKKIWENKKDEDEISETEEFLSQNLSSKKKRSVCFRKNPELDLSGSGRAAEIKQKKTTIQDKESTFQDKKEKTKNG